MMDAQRPRARWRRTWLERSLPAEYQIDLGSASSRPYYGGAVGLFTGANFNFNDRQDMQTFAYEFMGVLNNQIRAVGGTP
jgi:hypothetical protein